MIYGLLRDRLLGWLAVAPGPPEPPAGTHASIRVFRASPRYLRYRLLGLAIGGGLVVAALLAAAVGLALAGETAGLVALLLVGAVTLGIVALVYAGLRIDYEVRHYVFTDRSVRVREGAWTVRERTLGFANVQNLRVTQGPLQRLFGISDLRMDTAGGGGGQGAQGGAGGGGHALRVAGVENAAELRELVAEYVRRRADAGLGDPDDRRLRRRRAPGTGAPPPAVRDALRGVLEEARKLRAAAGG